MTTPVQQSEGLAPVRRTFRQVCGRVWVLICIISVAAYVLSTTIVPVRLLYLATAAVGVLAGIGYLIHWARGRPWLSSLYVMLAIGVVAWGVLAGRMPDPERLATAYRARLLAFRHTHYVWGGETHVGIDCSGLARIALCEAMLCEGVRTANPRLLGPVLWRFWWQDISARAIRDGNFGYTSVLGYVPALAGYPAAELQPGDLAVTDGGGHVLIFVGDRRWIEANASDGTVVVSTANRDSQRCYFNMPMTLVRWWILDPHTSPF